MKRVLAYAMGTMLLTLWATAAALAATAAPPHNYNCTNSICHNPSNITDLTRAVGVNNLCLGCHNPAITFKTFSPKDLANPFGSTVLGVYTSGRKQTSHNWYAPVSVPPAGAAAPQTADSTGTKLLVTLGGTVNCGTCHDPHDNTNGNFLRIPNNSDQLCLDCHRSRNTSDQTRGTHPVTVNYAASAAAHPAKFQPLPLNANPANPTSAMKLVGGQVLCSTCHGVHFSDSNARTFDNASSSYFGRLSSSRGYLLRTDLRGGTANAVNICSNCHAGKLAHNKNGQNIQCADCHGGHVDPGDGSRPNVSLVRRYMNYSAGIQLSSYRRVVFNQYTASGSNWAGSDGVCQACHFVPPPGGSFPAEHASTDPNVCRSCHAHNSSSSSFSANCSGCHGFPPQQNSPGGPLGYANTPYNYGNSPAFKDESRTPHFAHAGKAPYSYGCSECHLGSKHASGNFQQVFNSKIGIIAATGGAVPVYSSAASGTCSNVYCHSNGAPVGVATLYKSPVWASAEGSIIGTQGECSACHDASPATNAHPGHLNSGFGCSLCHAATVSDNSTVKDTARHVNGIKDVQFSGSGAYDNSTHKCSNLYCHSNGNQGMPIYVDPAAWNSGVNYGCNGCHGTGNTIGAPDYANGGAGTKTANTHGPHVTGATGTTVCADCHFATASSTTAGALVANSQHLSGAVNVVFNPATAGSAASWDPATGTCSNVACHGGAPAQWGSSAACLTCHAFAIGNRAAIGPQFGANSHHYQGAASITAAQCYQCHWEANSDGSINHAYHHSNIQGGPVELVIYGAGIRPTGYALGTTAIQYSANGSRTEMAKINSHCLGCHSDQNNTTQPFGDGKTPSAYAWDKASIAAKYGDSGTTSWGKYSGGNVTPKNTVAKAFSAHGNAAANQAGWDINETWPNTTGTAAVLCFDCHNSHGSTVVGTTTGYASATVNGGILKDTVAGKGGYATTYQPKAGGTATERNLYNPGAGLCFDCHQTASAGSTPWGYSSTFSASQAILGYLDTPSFGNGQFGYQLRNPYKVNVSSGGHFGATSPLSATPSHAIGGLCTPCHDPHGVSPTLGANKQYGVPLLKGTWMTSPYREDNCTADNATYGFISGVRGEEKPRPATGAYTAYQAATASYKIDQNTFASGSITETDQQFGGLCLNCHGKQSLTNGTTHTWKSKDRVHESVKGWKTANTTIKHNYSCSKCHAPHNAQLPRLMISNCLDYKHRGRVTNNANPALSFSYRGEEGRGGGNIPGIYAGISNENSGGSTSGTGPVSSSFSSCHEGNTGSPTDQYWNVKTPWTSGTALPFLASPMLVAEPDAICSGSCGTQLQWNAVTNQGGGAVQYLVQVSSSSTFATVNFSSGWISSTSYTPTLAVGTWYWRVQARDSAKTTTVSAWSYTDSFILATSLPPSKPLLIAEPNATCSGSCATQLQWGASTNSGGAAVQYQVQVSSDISFATVSFSSGWISTTSYTPTLTAGTWYWRVQARDSVKTTLVSAWSLAGSFTLSATSGGPTVPTLITEPNATCSGSCATQLQWNASTISGGGAVQYQVQVSSDTSFATINFSSGWISTTSYTPTLTAGVWYWRVQARDSVTTTNISAWSTVGSFTLSASTGTNPPTAPVLVAEPDARCSTSTGCSIGLQWNASTNPSGGSVQYLVQVSSSSSFTTIKTSSSWQTGVSWTAKLPKGTWYWRVQARDAAVTTRVSSWSAIDSFILN